MDKINNSFLDPNRQSRFINEYISGILIRKELYLLKKPKYLGYIKQLLQILDIYWKRLIIVARSMEK